MKKITLILIPLILTWIVAGTAAAEKPFCMNGETGAHCRGMGHQNAGFMNGHDLVKGIGGITLKALMNLDLSDAQKKDVANILADHRDAGRKMADQLMVAKKAFMDTITSETARDESAVRDSFRHMSTIMENLVVQKAKIMAALRPILSKDQLEGLMAHPQKKCVHKKQKKEIKKRIESHRAMMDTWINTYADVNR